MGSIQPHYDPYAQQFNPDAPPPPMQPGVQPGGYDPNSAYPPFHN